MAIKIKKRVNAQGKTRYLALYGTPDGRYLSAGTFGDKKAAEKAAYGAEKKAEKATWVDPKSGKQTLRAYCESTWLKTLDLREVTTQEAYRVYYTKHILPAFGDRALSSIRPSEIQVWLSQIESRLSPTTAEKAKVILGLIFSWAVKDHLLETNPCASVDNPTVVRPPVKIMTPEQFDAFHACVPGETNQGFVLTAIGTGMRWSELVGLTPSQVDFLGRTITVNRAVVEVNAERNDGAGILRKPYPKGRGTRLIPVDDDVLAALSIEIKRHRLEPRSEEEIFRATRGGLMLNSPFLYRVLLPGMRKAGLEDYGYRMKHLRSSYCSWLLAGGADLAIVQKLMGHANIQTTQRYIQTLPEAVDKARDVLTSVRTRSHGSVSTLRSAR